MSVRDCEHERCQVPHGRICRYDNDLEFQKCPHFQQAQKQAHSTRAAGDDSAIAIEEGELLPPWTGFTMPPTQTLLIWGDRRPVVLTLVGLSGSGKTSFLSTFYLRFLTEGLEGWTFAGSLTLRGWAAVTDNLLWERGRYPKYPPKTSGEGREPGYLHLALRDEHGEVVDLLLADVPGDWYTPWLVNASSKDAEAPRWTLTHTDAMLFFVDLDDLNDPQSRAVTSTRTRTLIDRVAQHCPHLPTVVVYAKQDKEPVNTNNPFLAQVSDRINQRFPRYVEQRTIAARVEPHDGITPGSGVLEAVGHALKAALAAQSAPPDNDNTFKEDDVSWHLAWFHRERQV